MARKAAPRKSYPSSAASIQTLRSRGMNDAAIGRMIGRDSSLISQISRGKKPGRNLEASLNSLVEGKRVKEPERRKSKSGRAARVRDGQLKEVRISARDLLRTVQLMATRGQRLTIEATWGAIVNISYRGQNMASGSRMIYGNGEDAASFAKRLARFMKSHPKLSDREQADAFLNREFSKRDTPSGARLKKADRPAYSDLQSINITKKDGRPKRTKQ